MNVNSDALTRAYALAHDSGKVDTGRLSRALKLVPNVVKTFTHVYTDHSRIDEYFIPGSAHTGYVVTVRNGKSVSGCTCKDHVKRGTVWCYHRLSIALIVRAGELVPGSVAANDPALPASITDPTYRSRMVAALWPQDGD